MTTKNEKDEKLYTEAEMEKALEEARFDANYDPTMRSPYGCCYVMAGKMLEELFDLVDNNAEKVLREVIADDLFDLYKQKRERVRIAGATAENRRKNIEKFLGKKVS